MQMDKTSVLGEAIKYLKQLQERVKTLEEQSTKQTMESVVFVKKSHLLLEDDACSSDAGGSNEPLPEIEARVCDKNVLLRIHCEKRKGLLVKVLAEIEKLNLSVINTSVSPFGTLALDITIIAEMEKEFSMTVKDIVKSLRSVLRRFMQKTA
uniref:Putative transcription factor bHLH18-like n=1 Tax=Davidia involucrata TaxID=16924 RepID=A0A5B7BEH9_DAVIN